MIKLRVLDILKEQGHTKYWLYNRMEMSYHNFNQMVSNRTSRINFEKIERLCSILNCTPSDIFEITPDPQEQKRS